MLPLVLQNARMALGVADDAHVLEVGRIRLCGAARQIVSDPQLLAARLRG
jgi:ABC-type branched-subunit amino acid transport system ATPase component